VAGLLSMSPGDVRSVVMIVPGCKNSPRVSMISRSAVRCDTLMTVSRSSTSGIATRISLPLTVSFISSVGMPVERRRSRTARQSSKLAGPYGPPSTSTSKTSTVPPSSRVPTFPNGLGVSSCWSVGNGTVQPASPTQAIRTKIKVTIRFMAMPALSGCFLLSRSRHRRRRTCV
jgi:hypothetical protein